MPTPAVSLKLKKFRRRFGIGAPRVIVRSHLGWPWYVGGLCTVVLLLAVAAWLILYRGENGSLYRHLDELQQRLAEAEAEAARLRGERGTEQSSLQMEKAAQEHLLLRIKSLEAENAGLREERSLFEKLGKDCRKPAVGGR